MLAVHPWVPLPAEAPDDDDHERAQKPVREQVLVARRKKMRGPCVMSSLENTTAPSSARTTAGIGGPAE